MNNLTQKNVNKKVHVEKTVVTDNILYALALKSKPEIAIGEAIVNGVAAAKEKDGERVVEVKFISGADIEALGLESFGFEKDAEYVAVLNTGAPIQSLGAAMNIAVSSKSGPNHVFGLGLKFFIGKIASETQHFFLFTKKGKKASLYKYPIEEEKKIEDFSAAHWPFGDYVTAVIARIDKPCEIHKQKIEKYLSWKFSEVIQCDKHFKLIFDGTAVRPDTVAGYMLVETRSLYSETLNSDIVVKCYTKDASGKAKTAAKYRGFTIVNDGIAIEHADVLPVAKQNFKDEDALDWNEDKSYTVHGNFNEYATYVSIYPRSNKFEFPYAPDKSGIDWETVNGKILRKIVDEIDGERYRVLQYKKLEAGTREAIDEFLSETTKNDSQRKYFKEVPIGTKELWEGDAPKRIDGIEIEVTDKNRAKIEDWMNKNSSIKGYPIGAEDAGRCKLYEFKALKNRCIDDYNIYQAKRYADHLCDFFGFKREEIFIFMVGQEYNCAARKYAKELIASGYNIQRLDPMLKAELD